MKHNTSITVQNMENIIAKHKQKPTHTLLSIHLYIKYDS